MANYQSSYTGAQHDQYASRQALVDLIYPVGAIYMSMNSTEPSTLFGGTWEQIEGKFLLGCDSTYTAGSTGGEATHTLVQSEMPAHTHTRGTMEITGTYKTAWGDKSGGGIINGGNYGGALDGFHSGNSYYPNPTYVYESTAESHRNWLRLTASNGWTGATSSEGGAAATTICRHIFLYICGEGQHNHLFKGGDING